MLPDDTERRLQLVVPKNQFRLVVFGSACMHSNCFSVLHSLVFELQVHVASPTHAICCEGFCCLKCINMQPMQLWQNQRRTMQYN